MLLHGYQAAQNRRNRRGNFLALVLLMVLLLNAHPFTDAAALDCPNLTTSGAKNRMAHLEQEIAFHDELYYKSSRPVLTDAQYDLLFAELVLMEQCFPLLAAAESPTRTIPSDSGSKLLALRHERPMLSLSSSTGPEAVQALLHRAAAKGNKPMLLVQPKVDGLPVELVYESGRLVSAATRGDGRAGADVTKQVRIIPGIPQQLSGSFPSRVTVRGEVYADRALMARYAGGPGKTYATARHFAAAALKSRHPAPLALAALRLFPFELLNAEEGSVATSDLAALRVLSAWGLPVRLDLTLQVQGLDQIRAAYGKYLAGRGELPFAADGIVVKVDDLHLRRSLGEGSRSPLWAAAWKFPPQTARTVVREIRWQTGRTGRRTPIAEVVPVSLGEIRVSRVSLNNAETVQRLGIAAGDGIVIALVADIIPQVLEVERGKGRAAGPDSPSAGAPESGPAACLRDAPGCREQFLARAVHFASRGGLNIPGLGPGRLRKLVEAGLVSDLPSLFRLQKEEVAAVSGFGVDSARRLTEALRRVGRPEPFRLVAALGIPGVGPVAARRLAKKFESLDALLILPEDSSEGRGAAQKVRAFFGSPQGRELLRALREADLL